MKTLSRKLFLTTLMLFATFAQAEELGFYIDPNFTACNTSKYNQFNVKTNFAEFKYDTITKLLNVEVEFTDQGGTSLANGFQFGLNSESDLITNNYKLAYFYVDGTNLKSGIAPTITAYIYNREAQPESSCNNSPGSWQTDPGIGLNKTEPILLSSTSNTNPDWVSFAEMSDSTLSGVTKRKFTIILDTTQIQAFIPNNTPEYQQEMAVSCKTSSRGCLNYNKLTRIFDFGREVSVEKWLTLDFVPSVISNSTYGTDNLISAFSLSSCSLCRAERRVPNTSPTCTGVTGIASQIGVGESVEASVHFSDDDTNDQHRVQFLSSLKPSMQFVSKPNNNPIINDGIIPTGENQSVTLNWTPTEADVGSYSIPVRFQQIYGQNGSSTEVTDCTLNFEVLSSAPICQSNDITGILNQIKTNISSLKSFLLAKNSYNQSYLTTARQKKRQDFSTKINNYSQVVQNQINSLPNPFITCSSGYSACQQIDTYNQLHEAGENIKMTYCDGQKISDCNFIDNIGLKLINRIRRNQILIGRANGTLTPAKLAIINKKFNNYQKKAADLSFNAYDGVSQLLANKYVLHFICE